MFGIRGASQIINIFRNWSRSYSAWVTILDTNLQPNAGPFHPQPTMIQIDPETLDVIYNLEYFVYGQFSKFIPRGSIRILSEDSVTDESKKALTHVAFQDTLSNKIILVVTNVEASIIKTQITYDGKFALLQLPPRSVSTFLWVP